MTAFRPSVLTRPASGWWSLRRLLPLTGLTALVLIWQQAVHLAEATLLPAPWAVVCGIGDLAQRGLLLKYVVASLFRVTFGYLTAIAFAIPLGLCLGWYRRGERAIGPLIHIFRPISALAWIPIAILWFGVGDLAAVFIIFLASFWPLVVSAMNAVRNVPAVHVNVGRNFGLSGARLLQHVIFPAAVPQLVVGLRLALGIAWLVDVAAEMIAVNSGLGFLIVDARNAGNRYDLVVGGMVLIGAIGLCLDLGIQRLDGTQSASEGVQGGEGAAQPLTEGA